MNGGETLNIFTNRHDFSVLNTNGFVFNLKIFVIKKGISVLTISIRNMVRYKLTTYRFKISTNKFEYKTDTLVI